MCEIIMCEIIISFPKHFAMMIIITFQITNTLLLLCYAVACPHLRGQE